MSFQINTNSYVLNTLASANKTNNELSSSLEKLSSGKRINKSADDASGLLIANTLRMQASSLNQATSNAKGAVNLVQIADNALEEVDKILTTIKSKAIQSAEDGQTSKTRLAIQKDVNRLIESLDNVSKTTKYNGQNLLSGAFANKEFQVGAYSNETIKMSIASTDSSHIGHTRMEKLEMDGLTAGAVAIALGDTVNLTIDGTALHSMVIDKDAGTGVGKLAELINKNTDLVGSTASYHVEIKGTSAVKAGSVTSLTINGTSIGAISSIKDNDEDGKLVNAINSQSHITGVVANVDEQGVLHLHSRDGRAIDVDATEVDTVPAAAEIMMIMETGGVAGTTNVTEIGDLMITSNGAEDIAITGNIGATAIDGATLPAAAAAEIYNLASLVTGGGNTAYSGGMILSRDGAQTAMKIADAALEIIDSIRSDIGSVQQQLNSTINNITITAANVQIAEGGIRDVDFAAESANFNKNKLLAQSGTYALSQANEVKQNVMTLLR